MKMIMLWIVFTLVIGLRVEKLDRWVIGSYVALCFLNLVYAYTQFGK
ncbi:MAG: hypothetical protein DHS20C15_15100 [Planctomycetota bacterium]|nr:MAG: hypothetical protein DHS20C15_15100 [Planctomycetota bacterium]